MTGRDVAMLVALAALWGGSYLFIRVSVTELGPFPLMLARVVLGGALLATLRSVRRGAAAAGTVRTHWRELLVLGGANAALPFSLIAAAELRLGAPMAAILTAATPLCSMIIEARWTGERIGARRSAGLLVGMAGVTTLVGWSPERLDATMLLAVAAMLAACCGYAFAGVYARHRLAGAPPAALALGQQLGAAAWLAVPALLTLPSARPSDRAVMATLALAALSTAVAYLLYFRLLSRIGPTRTSMVTYLIPIFGTAWGALFLDEVVTAGMLGGMAMILASVVLVNGTRRSMIAPRAVVRRSS